MKLTDEQFEFLDKLHKHRGDGTSVREIGRRIYSADRSIYMVLDYFYDNDLVKLTKGHKLVTATLTKAGLKLLGDYYHTLTFKDYDRKV